MNDEELLELKNAPISTGVNETADKLISIAIRQLETSTNDKRERMNKIKKYEELRQGKVPKRFRQLFNVPFPIFQSFVDALESDFSDPITATFKEEDPTDYFKVKKIQAAWDGQIKMLTPSAMWNLKVRLDRTNAIMSGRGIMKYYASSMPEYQSHFDVVNYNFFHCQPAGGAHLENHLFAGEEMILKTQQQLIDGVDAGIYDREQVRKLIGTAAGTDYIKDMPQDVLAKFRALGLDPSSNNYVGETTFALCQWVLTYGNTRWYILFDPFQKTWIRCDKLSEIYSGDYMPWVSWSTHEDDKVFWNVGYSDFFYPIADAAMILLNQELTNREKQNFNARAYDETIFTDEQILDEAQYRPDVLVPVSGLASGKSIQQGIYRFDTPQLGGTINLSEWIIEKGGLMGGANEVQQGAPAGKGAKAYVQFAQQQQIAKRISYKSQSYQEAYQQIALRFIQGLKDNMSSKMAIRMVGPEGYDHWDEIRRIDLNLTRTPRIEIISTTAQEQANKMKVDQQVQALAAIAGSPYVNERTRVEFILKNGGHFEDMEVSQLMDVNSSIDKEVQAKAAIAIKMLMEGKEPEMNYNADLAFLEIINSFLQNHLTRIKKLGVQKDFVEYIKRIGPVAQQNMKKLAEQIKQDRAMSQLQGQGGSAASQPQPQQKKPIAPKKPSAKGKAVSSPLNIQQPNVQV